MISLQDATSGSGNRHSASIGAGTSVAGSRAPSPSTIGESDPQLPPTLSLQRSRKLDSVVYTLFLVCMLYLLCKHVWEVA